MEPVALHRRSQHRNPRGWRHGAGNRTRLRPLRPPLDRFDRHSAGRLGLDEPGLCGQHLAILHRHDLGSCYPAGHDQPRRPGCGQQVVRTPAGPSHRHIRHGPAHRERHLAHHRSSLGWQLRLAQRFLRSGGGHLDRRSPPRVPVPAPPPGGPGNGTGRVIQRPGTWV